MSEIHEGGCLCGSVRYRTVGAPVGATICYCTFCQWWTVIPADVERFEKGAPV